MPYLIMSIGILPALLLSGDAIAAVVEPAMPNDQLLGQVLKVFLALAITLATIWGLSKIAMKKQWARGTENQRIKLVDSLAIGTRDRIMLLEVDNKNILVASTPGQIRSLHAFDKNNTESFSDMLNSANAGDAEPDVNASERTL